MPTLMSPFRLGPEWTPKIVKKLLFATIFVSLSCALINAFFIQVLGMPGPEQWLSLSWWGINRYFFWQPVSYLFVLPLGYGVGFSFIISLLFYLYLVWILGTDISQRVSEKSFLRLYLVSGILGGLITLFLMPILGQYTTLAGPTSAIMGLLIAWAFLHPEQELLLLFLLPIKAKWLSLGIIGLALLISFSNLHFVNFFLYLSGALTGYAYSLIAWGVHSPFPRLYRAELFAIRCSQKVQKAIYSRFSRKMRSNENKVVNIQTGEFHDDDEAFIDAMLEKISRYGESSLSYSERERMGKISKTKPKK